MFGVGVLCRLHDANGDDRGLAHLPHPVEIGDLAATETDEFRVLAVIVSPPGAAIGALVRVQPIHLRVVAA